MRLLLLVLCFIVSCAHNPLHHSFQTTTSAHSRYGFTIRAQQGVTINVQKIDEVIYWTMNALIYKGLYSPAQLRKALEYAPLYDIYLVTGNELKCTTGVQCEGEFLAGSRFFKGGSIAFPAESCKNYSFLGHELIHYFDYIVADTIDSYHRRSEFFKFGCLWKYIPPSDESKDTAENKILRQKCKEDSVEGIVEARVLYNICQE